MTTIDITNYLQKFLATLPPGSPVRDQVPRAEQFGDTPELADQLLALIIEGTKTATCSALWEWEAEGESIPTVGSLQIVLDGNGRPGCVIEITEVTIRRFGEVDASFACDEGEGDQSLANWRAVHRALFTRSLSRLGRVVDDTLPLVCERFRVIYR